MNKRFSVRFPLLFIVAILVLVSSCRAPKELAVANVKPMSTNKLLKNIEQNSFDYEDLTIRKINCQYSSSQSKASFRINLKARKDEKILVSISKLNIPVGRVLLTPDSVIYVNYIDHNYFVGDYSFISDFLNMDVDFKTVQSIISNNAFSYRNDPRDDYKTFDSFVENGKYVLQSEKTRKIYKLDDKRPQKIERRLKRLDDEALILQKMFFEPRNFSLTQLSIQDKTNNRNIFMGFNDFTEVDGKEYPGEIDMEFLSAEEQIQMKIRMSGFSTEEITSFSIKIPEKYEEIQVK
ncbi:DUF4292 domain-containing protein [Maribellus sediminis]|uniref:DUF4292 domain-containing protein n=1 Tax=Maribellus sediminis TaxID=2696285 RepID=UPI00142F938E|nr:DUF4292 domain-containing protein [Maribellus sediminis]